MVQANLPQWWDDFVQQGETLAIKVQPCVRARILGIPLSTELPSIQTEVHIPIMTNVGSTEPITMGFDDAPLWEMAQNPNEHFVVSPPTPARPILTVQSWELHWGDVTEETTQILGTIVLRNELAVPVPVQGLRLELDMNEIRVVPDANITPTRSELPPSQSVALVLEANVDNANLVRWWTSHLQHQENTTVTARLGVTIVLPITSGLGLTEPLPLPLMPVPRFECNIHTDILGMANYRIAQMLGKPLAEEPKAVEVECSAKLPQLGIITPVIPQSIQVSPASASITAGQTQQFAGMGTYSDNSTADLTNTAIWTPIGIVGPGGLAVGLFPGTYDITATVGTVHGSATLTVTSPILQSITVSPTSASIAAGQTRQFSATGNYSDGSTANLTNTAIWTPIGIVGPGGLAVGLFPGTYDITATVGTVHGSATLTVTAIVFTEDFESAFPGSWSVGDNGVNGEDYWGDTSYRSHAGTWSGWCAQAGSKLGTVTDRIFYEDFEGVFWFWNWYRGDSDTRNGADYWGDNSYRAYAGSWSAYCADESDVAGQYYDNYMYAYMYRTVNLGGYNLATLSYYYWLDSQSNYDYLKVGYSEGGSWYWPKSYSGYSGGWVYDSLSIPTTATAVGFLFQSDSVITREGAYVDEVYLTGTRTVDTPNSDTHTYDDNMDAYMYRSVNLSGYGSATPSYWYWLDSQSGYDKLYVIYYEGGSWHFVDEHSGNSGGWQSSSVSIPISASYVGFHFHSDASIHAYEGAYVDDIVLSANVGAPTITSVNPSGGNQGQTLIVTITRNYLTRATGVSFGPGITTNSFTLDSSTQITANITIEGAATSGARNVLVTTPGGTPILTGGFSVAQAGAPLSPWIWVGISLGVITFG
jgi:LEA14-like dessication related protein